MNKRTLADVADIQTGPFGSQLHKEDYSDIGIPIVTVEHLGERSFSEQNLPLVHEEDANRLSKYRMKSGDIIFSRVGSVDRCSFADRNNDGWLFSGRCLRIRSHGEYDPEFLYYYLSSNNVRRFIRNIAVGATMPSINTTLMGEIPIPPIDPRVQSQVASVGTAIDKKISINNRVNGYLAEMAEAIAAKYCEQGGIRLGDICHQVAERVDCGEAKLETYVSTESLLQDKKGRQLAASLPATGKVTRFVAGDTLVSNIRPYFKKVWYASFDGTCSSDVLVLRANAANDAPYIHACLRQDSFFDHVMRGAKGTKMPRGDKKQMMEFRIAPTCEPDDLSVLSASLKQISLNDAESAKLVVLRNRLLPKLMSGEIDVSQIDAKRLNSHLYGQERVGDQTQHRE